VASNLTLFRIDRYNRRGVACQPFGDSLCPSGSTSLSGINWHCASCSCAIRRSSRWSLSCSGYGRPDLPRSARYADLPRSARYADLPRSARYADLPRSARYADLPRSARYADLPRSADLPLPVRAPLATPTHAPPCATTGPARASTAIPTTSSPRTWPLADDNARTSIR
jgi:hypothetical protein